MSDDQKNDDQDRLRSSKFPARYPPDWFNAPSMTINIKEEMTKQRANEKNRKLNYQCIAFYGLILVGFVILFWVLAYLLYLPWRL